MNAAHEFLINAHYFWLFYSTIIYVLCERVWAHCGKKNYLMPAMWALIVVAITVYCSGTSYEAYKRATAPIAYLLTVSTVVLAFPIYRQWPRLRRHLLPLLTTIVFGSLAASLSAYGVSKLITSDRAIITCGLIKSITTPIAMAVAEKMDGNVSLIVVIVFVVGIAGSLTAPLALRIAGVNNAMLRGLVYGITAHGLGTATALQESEECGAFSGLAMGLNGIVTALTVPLMVIVFNML